MIYRRATLTILLLVSLSALGCQQRDIRGVPPSREVAEEMRITLAKSVKDQGVSKPVGKVQKRTGWATLRGTVKVVGGVPQRTTLNINKDPQVCAPGGAPVLSQAAVADPASGGLADVVFYAIDVPGENVHPDAQAGKTDAVVFDQKQCIFLTHLQVMQATQQLKILNSDSVPHNTKIDGKRAQFANISIGPGDQKIYTPGKAENEPIPVSCSIHPWMSAFLLPRNDSYAAVSAKDGTFEIPNLPAGVDLVVQVWQQRLGKNFKDIQVDGTKTTWKRGRIEFTKDNQLKPDETRTLDVEIPVSLFQ